MKVQFTDAEMAELEALDKRYDERMKNALERIAPFHGDNSGDDLKTQYQRYLKGLDDDSKKALREYDDILIEATRERGKLLSRFMAESVTIGSEVEILESIIARTTTPEELIFSTSKLTREIFNGDQVKTGKPQKINVQKANIAKKNPVNTWVWIPIDEMKEKGIIDAWRDFSQYDQEVLEAVTTLYVEGNDYITESMIYDLMTGKPGGTLSENQKEEINATLTKFMYTPIRIDSTQETKMGWTPFKYDAPILPAERVTAIINGNEVSCIHPFKTPPIYEYSALKNQLGRMKVRLLKTPIKKNPEVIAIQGYLYRQIIRMNRNPKQNRSIKYDSVFKAIGIEAKTDGAFRKKTMKVRNTIRTILDFWKQERFIKGYSEYYGAKGKHIGVKIMIS